MARNNKMPRQAAKEARKAEAEYKKAYPDAAEPTPPAPTLEVVPDDPAAEAKPAEAKVSAEETPPVETPPAEPPKEEKVNWEQKYRTLDGKYTAEVPRLQQENNTLKQRMDSMEHELIKRATEAKPPEPKETPKKDEPLITPEEVEDYGTDMLSVVKRAAREELMPELVKLRKENEELRTNVGQVESTITATTQDNLFDTLAAAVPNWRDVNTDKNFLDWLTQTDVYSGVQRQELLTKAFDTNDSNRVIQFFKGFISEQTPPKAETPPAQPDNKLDTLVAPGRPKGSTDTGGAQQSEIIWTEQSIADFYASAQRGHFKGREAEKEKYERDIFAAMKEGRIR